MASRRCRPRDRHGPDRRVRCRDGLQRHPPFREWHCGGRASGSFHRGRSGRDGWHVTHRLPPDHRLVADHLRAVHDRPGRGADPARVARRVRHQRLVHDRSGRLPARRARETRHDPRDRRVPGRCGPGRPASSRYRPDADRSADGSDPSAARPGVVTGVHRGRPGHAGDRRCAIASSAGPGRGRSDRSVRDPAERHARPVPEGPADRRVQPGGRVGRCPLQPGPGAAGDLVGRTHRLRPGKRPLDASRLRARTADRLHLHRRR